MVRKRICASCLTLAGRLLSVFGTCAADGLDAWRQPSLNPVELKAVAGAKEVVLTDDGRAGVVLVIPARRDDVPIRGVPYCPDGPTAFGRNQTAAALAAEEIVAYVKKTAGVELPVVTDGAPVPKGLTPVYVGMSAAARAAGLTADGIPEEGFRIACDGKSVGIIGAAPGKMSAVDGVGAVLFGAYDFLERFVGVRFYGHGELGVVTHPKRRIVIPAVTYCDWPRYDQRVAYSWMWRDRADNCSQKTALRMRSGNHSWGALPVYQHTPFDISKLFEGEDRETCLTLNRESGKRSTTHPPVPCFGNPKTLDYVMKAWEGFYAGDKRAIEAVHQCVPDANAIGFSCPDHSVACDCPFCAGKTNRVTGAMGVRRERWSEHIGRFAAELSHRVKARFPGKRFYWLPYASYCAPPKTREFADNTYFRICFMSGTSVYADPFVKKRYRDYIDYWYGKGAGGKLAGYLYTWPGVENEITIPYQFPHALKQFFTDMQDRISGFFLCFLPDPQAHPLSCYCEMRLLWNPAFDVDACAAEMYADLFGPMAPAMSKAYAALTKKFEETPASSFRYALDGGPGNYQGPRFLEEEAFGTLFSEREVAVVTAALAEADALVGSADADCRARYEYHALPFRTAVKRREFWTRGGTTAEKSIVARGCGASARTLKVDGVLDEKFWEKAAPARMVRSELVLYADKPDVPTTIRVVRHATSDPAQGGLVVGLEMSEPEMARRVNEKPDRQIYWDDNVEVFFDANPKHGKPSGNFLQYVISSDGRILCGDGKQLIPGEEMKDPPRYAVHRGADRWSVELFIPYSRLFRAMDAKSRLGLRTVKANFARRRHLVRADGTRYVFSSRWRTNFEHDNANVKQFGDVILRRDPADFGDPFVLTPTRVNAKPTVDGSFADAVWKGVPSQRFHHAPLELKPREADVGTRFRVLRWDDPQDPSRSGLCFGFQFDEPDMAAAVIKPEGMGLGDYVDFRLELASAPGHIVHYLFDLSGRNEHFGYAEPEYAVRKHPKCWTLEFFVPFRQLFSAAHPRPEEWPDTPELRFNMRRRRVNGTSGRETSFWSVNSVSDFENLDSFGVIRLQDAGGARD